MSKIFHSGSGVEFESIRFQDLELISKEKGFSFVPRFPVKSLEVKNNDKKAERSNKTNRESSAEKNIDIDAIKEEAYLKGKVDGRLEAEEKLHSATQALKIGLEEISCLTKSLLVKSKEDMVRLIMAVAKQVIHTEIGVNETIVLNTVSRVLQTAIQADKYYIRVNPEDFKIVTEKEPLFLACMKGLQHIYFLADETVSRGGCLAESQAGEVDATVESQLAEIYQHLCKEIL